jgi:hypothetical protein
MRKFFQLQDLEYDRQLQDVPRLLPTSLNLPAITATEYCVNYVHQLRSVLGQCPPNQPTEMAIDMLVAVAQLQRCGWCMQQCSKPISGSNSSKQLASLLGLFCGALSPYALLVVVG